MSGSEIRFPFPCGKGLGVRFRVLPRPLFSRERQSAALRPAGEGSAAQAESKRGQRLYRKGHAERTQGQRVLKDHVKLTRRRTLT